MTCPFEMRVIIEQLEYTADENISIAETKEIETQFELQTVRTSNAELPKTI